MNGIYRIEKIREYCDYVETHLLNIKKSWQVIQLRCKDMKFIYTDYMRVIIDNMIRDHDLSKFSADEFIQYTNQFFPVDGEEKCKADFLAAWEHHKKHNKHHWQNWVTGDIDEWKLHCVCMIVDWMAMGLQFGDTAQEYYESNIDQIKLPEYAIDFVYEIFERIDERKI